MRYVKWTFLTLIALIVAGFLHYTLPQHDIVRVVNTYQERQDLGDWTRIFWSTPDDQSGTLANRDVQFISTVMPNGKPMVYRNEDTGWNWPPYFKFDTASLQTQADDLKSTAEAPKWVMVTKYGWRFPFLSIYPNAVSVREVSGPDASVIPWVNIIILTALGFILFMIRRMWLQFWERMVDPAIAEVEEAQDRARGFFGRIGDWFATWRRKR